MMTKAMEMAVRGEAVRRGLELRDVRVVDLLTDETLGAELALYDERGELMDARVDLVELGRFLGVLRLEVVQPAAVAAA